MGRYTVIVSDRAKIDLAAHYRTGGKTVVRRIEKIFIELADHPQMGIGKPEKLRGNMVGFWSRRIDRSNRIVYEIQDEQIVVNVIAARGHYGDK